MGPRFCISALSVIVRISPDYVAEQIFSQNSRLRTCLSGGNRERQVLVHTIYERFQFALQRFDLIQHYFFDDIFLDVSLRFNPVIERVCGRYSLPVS